MIDKKEVIDTTRELAGQIDNCIAQYVSACLKGDEMQKEMEIHRGFDMLSGIEQQLCFLADYIEKGGI